MVARIDTTITTEVEVDGETFIVKTLTAREKLSLTKIALQVNEIIERFQVEGKEFTPDAMIDIHEHQYEVLKAGLSEDPDLIEPRHWSVLVEAVYEANSLTEEDAKNSQSV